MPSNPGAKRNQEKQKRKREVAQRARKEAAARAKARAPQVPEEPPPAADEVPSPYGAGPRPVDFDELDELAEAAAELIKKKKIDEAGKKAAELVRRFPDEPDGWEAFARVYEARGDLTRAVAEMERAAQRVSKEDDVATAKITKALARLRAAAAKAK